MRKNSLKKMSVVQTDAGSCIIRQADTLDTQCIRAFTKSGMFRATYNLDLTLNVFETYVCFLKKWSMGDRNDK